MPPPESGPVDFMHPSLGPPKDRPHQGPSLKIHEGQAVRGGARELPWQLDLDFIPCCWCLTLHFRTPYTNAVGQYGCVSKDLGRTVGPMISSTFSLIPNDFPVLPKLPLKPLFQFYRCHRLTAPSGEGQAYSDQSFRQVPNISSSPTSFFV